MKFNNWDLVFSIRWDKNISAVVDFEKDDKVYVSPWWKSLSYPERLILDKELLFKKSEQQYHIRKEDVNGLMQSMLDIKWDIDNPPEEWKEKVWDQIEWRGYTYTLEEILEDGSQVYSRNNALYMFDEWDIKKLHWTKAQVIKDIYGLDIDNVVLE